MAKRISGIYAIKNLNTGKMYVGKSKNIFRRWEQHRYELRYNKHHSQYLQNSYNKHGEKNFIYGIIEECPSDNLSAREYYWAKYFDVERNGYNIEIPNPLEERLTVPQDLNIRLYNLKSKELINTLNNYEQCAIYFEVSLDTIKRAIKKIYERNTKKYSYKGFIIIKGDDTIERWLYSEKIRNLNKEISKLHNTINTFSIKEPLTKEEKSIISLKTREKVKQQTRDNKEYKWQVYHQDTPQNIKYYCFMSDVCEELNFNIRRTYKSIQKSPYDKYKGFIFKKING